MSTFGLIKEQFVQSTLIRSLARSDFRTRYVGSYYGLVWEILQPLSLIFLFWFVFEFALGITTIEGFPFVLWFIIGLIPWFFFSDAWSTATNAFVQYSFLVKKMVFKVEILPTVKILSSLMTSAIFHIILVIFLIVYGEGAQLSSLAVFYYLFCTIILVWGLSLITSSVLVFFKDMRQLLTIILQFGIYLTPILWSANAIPDKFHWFITINPMAYVVDGYRTAILGDLTFDPLGTAIFWAMAISFVIVGSIVFQRLRPHLADVL
ncbi:MAG: ABC transporter permease [Methanomassiliicoccales archaeon]